MEKRKEKENPRHGIHGPDISLTEFLLDCRDNCVRLLDPRNKAEGNT
jgi:hypothetical protein